MKRRSKNAVLTEDFIFDRSFPEPNSGCWVWMNCTTYDRSGYGTITYRGKMIGAHRAAYQCRHGIDLSPQQHVLHKCDVSVCVNPDHLFLGTHTENMADCARKRRNKYPIVRGEDSHLSILTEDSVRSIRASNASLSALAAKFGVSKHAIHCVVTRKTWKHVEPAA